MLPKQNDREKRFVPDFFIFPIFSHMLLSITYLYAFVNHSKKEWINMVFNRHVESPQKQKVETAHHFLLPLPRSFTSFRNDDILTLHCNYSETPRGNKRTHAAPFYFNLRFSIGF